MSPHKFIKNGSLRADLSVESSVEFIERLAGSITLPRRMSGLPVDQIIERAKTEYFRKHSAGFKNF